MCRLFAQISPVPASAFRHLAQSECSLLKQSHADKKNPQKDGWGIGYFLSNGKTAVEKSCRPAFKEREKFKEIALRARSKIILGHIRAASNPRGVSRNKLISKANSQPYTDGRWIFAHNGTLEIPEEVAQRLGSLRKKILSLNDSEVYFWQFLKFWKKTGNAAEAFADCIREDWRLWAKCKNRHPGKRAPYTSLNAVASDGKNLYAFCHAAQPSRSFGVCNPRQPWSVMSFSKRGGSVVVGSENLDRGRWTRFKPSEVLSIGASSAVPIIRRQRLKLPQGEM